MYLSKILVNERSQGKMKNRIAAIVQACLLTGLIVCMTVSVSAGKSSGPVTLTYAEVNPLEGTISGEMAKAFKEKAEEVKEKASEADEAAKEKVSEAKDEVKEKASEANEAVKEKADDAKEAIEEKAEEVKEAAKEKVSEVTKKAEEAKEAVEEKASEVKEAVEDKVSEVKEAVEGKSDESKDAEDEKEYTKCEWCGFKVEVGTDECPNCHNKIEPKKEAPKDEVKKEEAAEKSGDLEDEIPEGKKRCVKCGHLLDVDMTFCEECGEKQPAAGKSGLKSLFGKFKGGKH